MSFAQFEATNASGKKFIFKSTMVPPLSMEVLVAENGGKLPFSPDKMTYKYLNDLGGQNSAIKLIH